MNDLTAIEALISSPKDIVITIHANPDADALGSGLGLCLFLEKLGHNVVVISPTPYPGFLKWMKGQDEIQVYSEAMANQVSERIQNTDLIFCLDFSGLNRIEQLGPMVESSKATKIIIDHHQNPQNFDDYRIWDTSAAATAELIYDLIAGMGQRGLIDPAIANCLYAGVMTDTGNFRHPNTTAKVHRLVAELIELGADTSFVSRSIYDNNSINRLRFLGYALNDLLVFEEEMQTAYFTISEETAKKFELKEGDTEGLVNYALSLKGVVVAALLKEVQGKTKFSFRSVGDIAVNTFAENHFNGGGHKNAAGGRLQKPLNESLKIFRELILSNVLNTKKTK